MIIYLDESGDLGFDFTLAKTSRFFVMSLLVCEDAAVSQQIITAVKRTIKHKLGNRVKELKGSNTSLMVKKYFLAHMQQEKRWELLTIVADKKIWHRYHIARKQKLFAEFFYTEVAVRLLTAVKFSNAKSSVNLIIDRSMSKPLIEAFDKKLIHTLTPLIPSHYNLIIKHRNSELEAGLQAIDLFSWGVARKHQAGDLDWYSCFVDRLAVEMKYRF